MCASLLCSGISLQAKRRRKPTALQATDARLIKRAANTRWAPLRCQPQLNRLVRRFSRSFLAHVLHLADLRDFVEPVANWGGAQQTAMIPGATDRLWYAPLWQEPGCWCGLRI